MKRLTFALLVFLITSAMAHAAETPSPELIAQGRDLFNKKEGLGAKFACILCHKADKAIKHSDVEKAGDGLPAVINKYLTQKSKGPALAADSEKMKALMAYIRHEHAR
jgi:cytochrome c553